MDNRRLEDIPEEEMDFDEVVKIDTGDMTFEEFVKKVVSVPVEENESSNNENEEE